MIKYTWASNKCDHIKRRNDQYDWILYLAERAEQSYWKKKRKKERSKVKVEVKQHHHHQQHH